MDRATAEKISEAYEDLRRKCCKAAQANRGALMRDDAWLRNALNETDIWSLSPHDDGIECSGMTYTNQTMSNEWFTFTIPYSALES